MSAGPAAAAPPSRCATTTVENTRGWTTAAGGTVRVVPDGAQVATPDQDSEVQYRYTLPTRVRLSEVSTLSYELTKLDGTTVGGTAIPAGNDAALPAYRLFLDLTNNGSVDGAIVYEPYYQIEGNPARGQTTNWDVDAGTFWTGATIPGMVAEGGGSYANNKTLAQIRSANPAARVVAISVARAPTTTARSPGSTTSASTAAGCARSSTGGRPPFRRGACRSPWRAAATARAR
ncbi:hypothetical protein AB0J74_26885 [Asanoa sp. NPDC049573]|uniref:hypothetical protein n=1 Tax=Asanoa sp. NPDC049573 TaxID=3155396 RepID=UPI0034411992